MYVLYDVRNIGDEYFIPVIEVADTMTDTEINDYVVKLIKDTYSDYGQYVTSITKGVGEEYVKEAKDYFLRIYIDSKKGIEISEGKNSNNINARIWDYRK